MEEEAEKILVENARKLVALDDTQLIMAALAEIVTAFDGSSIAHIPIGTRLPLVIMLRRRGGLSGKEGLDDANEETT